MKRKLSLLLAVVMVLGSFSFAFAAETTAEEEAGNFLMEQGVIEGINGELKLDDNFRRQDMVVMLSRLMGAEDVAEAFPTDELTFTDFSDPYYKPIIAWAVAEGLIEGHTPERFGFGEDVTAQQYATVLLRALGYGDEVAGDGYAKALDLAKELGLLGDLELDNSTVVTRGQMYVLTVNALGTAVKDSEETLADKLGVTMPEPEALEVVGAYADNLKEVVVEFNKPVDTSTVTDDNVYVKNVDGTVVASEDGMTAVITVSDSLTNQKDYTVVVKGVKDTDGLEIAETELTFKAFDATLPEAVDIVVTGPRSFNIVFSEPIAKELDSEDVVGSVKVKQGNTSIGNKVNVTETNVVSVTVYRNLKDGEEYSVTVTDFHDFAGYKNVADTLTFVYEEDENPPVATVVKAEQTYVVVEFDKPVSGLSADKFYHTFNAWDAIGIFKDADMENSVSSSDSVTKVYVKFYEDDNDESRALPEGEVTFGINGSKIKDNWGNALGTVEFTVTVSADKTPLEVVELTVEDEDIIVVTFNKAVKSFDKDNVEILDEDGEKISGLTWKVKSGDTSKEYKIDLSKDMDGEVLTVVIKDVVDTALVPNKLSSHTEVIEITDKTRPGVKDVYYTVEKDDDGEFVSANLIVLFDEEVDGETALVASNYAIVASDDKVTILTKTPDFDLNSAKVVIPLTEAQYEEAKASEAKLQVINVEDLAGNAILPVQVDISEDVDTATKIIEATVKATATDTLVVTLDDIVSNVSEKHFSFENLTTSNVAFAITQSESGNSTVLEFVFDGDVVPYNPANVRVSYTTANDPIVNSFGIGVDKIVVDGSDIATVKPVDLIAPEWSIEKVAVGSYGYQEEFTTTGTPITVVLKFEEKLTTMGELDAVWADHITLEYDGDEVDFILEQENNKDQLTLTFIVEEDLTPGEGEEIKGSPSIEVSITENEYFTDEAGNPVVEGSDSVVYGETTIE